MELVRREIQAVSWGSRKLLEIADFSSIIGPLDPERSCKMAKQKDVVSRIKKATRRNFTADEKIRIVLEGLRGR
jgi:hypothetical protein